MLDHSSRAAVAALFFAVTIAGATVAHAADFRSGFKTRTFVGMWQAIDTTDGSTQLVSISCDRRRSCDVRLNDTNFSDCGDGLGYAEGDGMIDDGELRIAEFVLTCQSGEILREPDVFVPDFANRTLVNTEGFVFHKISR